MKSSLRITASLLVAAVLVGCVALLNAKQRRMNDVLPIVTRMAPPTYPPFARRVNVQGVVRVRVTTDGQRVTEVQPQGKPFPLLAALATKNVRTWQFEPGQPTTFAVTYAYKLTAHCACGADGESVTLKLPTDVEISAVPPSETDLPGKQRLGTGPGM